jgi:hypothetical protein
LIAYRAILDVPCELAQYVGRLLAAERRERGTRCDSRALTCFHQAALGLRWFRDNRDVAALARDHGISRATAYRYLAKVIRVLAAQPPDRHEALQQAKDNGASHVILDGKLFASDRLGEQTTSVKGKQIDAWYSGRHASRATTSKRCRHRTAFHRGFPRLNRARPTTCAQPAGQATDPQHRNREMPAARDDTSSPRAAAAGPGSDGAHPPRGRDQTAIR